MARPVARPPGHFLFRLTAVRQPDIDVTVIKNINTGIYVIRNAMGGDCYIGSAAQNFQFRWSEHRLDLNKGCHHNPRLQAAWKKYGEQMFSFTILQECLPEKCLEYEQRWMDVLNPEYNLCRKAGSRLGQKDSPETRLKKSLRCGHPQEVEARAKMSLAKHGNKNAFGHKMSAGLIEKLRAINLGSKHTEDHCRKIKESNLGSRNHFFGKKHTDESLEKMRIAKTGKHCSAETRAKMSASHLALNRKS